MHDVLAVHKVEGQEHLVDNTGGLGLREALLCPTSCYDLLHEVAARHQLRDDVKVLRVFHEFEDTCNVRVRCLLEHFKLILVKFLEYLVLTQLCLADNFDSAGHLRADMHAFFDSAELS